MTKLTDIAAKLQGLPLQKAPNKRLTIVGLSIIAVIMLGLNLTTKNISAAPWAPTAGNWTQRKQITLVNNSGATLHANTTYKISIDTAALYNGGYLVSTCDDLRIFYQPNDTTSVELKRNLEYASTGSASGTCATSTSTQIVFALQADMANAANSSSYYIYYDNPDAPAYAAADALDAYNIGSKEATFVAPFNGTTTALAVGSGTPTTETGAIRYSGSKSALSFDGKNDYASATVSISNANTTEAWVNFNKMTAAGYYGVVVGTNVLGPFALGINAQTTTPGFFIYDVNNGGKAVSPNSIATGGWHHLAGTYDGTTIKIYVDGVLKGTTNYVNTVAGGNIRIGLPGDGETQYAVNAIIDEVRISNTIRYTSNFTPQTSPFVRDEYTKLLLHFDENGDDPRNTGKAIDDSGNGNHGTITGAKYVAGLVGVDNSSTTTGNESSQSYASHQGVFIEEGTTNKITNPSFEHTTYNTNWSQPSVFDYDPSADTFTAGMAKRNSAGPFAAGVMVQGTSQGSASSGDVVTVSLGTTIASKFSSNLDADQGSIVLWWTPEFSDGDHGYSYLASAANGGIYLRYEYYYGGSPAYRFRFASGSTSSVYSKAITAGTTYCIVFRWDSKNTLDGTNYYSLSVDDVHAFSVSSPQTSTPTSPFYLGNWSTMQANGIIEGLTIYRRPLFDGTYGIDVGNGDEINQIYNSGTGKDPTLVTGSWDVVFALPTNSSTGSLLTGTGNAWSHPHASNLLYTSTTNTGGFMMNGTPVTDGWVEIPWYKVGGTSGVVAAYQPIGAASYAASKTNIANPGTYDATEGVAPSWDATNGWVFDGATTWLDTGWVPAYSQDQSMIAQLTGPTIGVTQFLLGSYNGASKAFVLTPMYGATRRYWNGGTYGVAPGIGSGVKANLAVAGAYGYKDGVLETGGPLAGWPSATTTTLYLGAARSTVVGDLPTGFSSSSLQSFAIYSTTLSSTQVANVTDAMEALTSSGTYLTPTALATNEKIFAGGYKFTSTGANQGISRSFTATNGGDYVLRAIGNSDGTCNPKIQVTRADGTTVITSLAGTTSSTRTAPNVYIFTWESPAAESEQVQLINTAASGTCYWHQVEVLSNLVNNPSMETGAVADPWIPTGWTNGGLDLGEGVQETSIVHSGASSFYASSADHNEGLTWPTKSVTTGKFYSLGAFYYNNVASTFFFGLNGGIWVNQAGDLGYLNSNNTWKHSAEVLRSVFTGTHNGGYFITNTDDREWRVDDHYVVALSDVSLTVTPATEANSLETSGLRVDGTDTLTQTVDSLTASNGKIKFKFTPRHSLAVADKFGSTFSNMTIFDARADTVNNRIWMTPISTTAVLIRGTFNGTVVDATWFSATLNAGTTYEAEINYTAGGSLNLKIDGVQVATNTGVVAFGTVPTTAYFGANYVGGWQYDATFTIPTFTGIVTPTENTTAPYYKFGSKSVKLVSSADGQYVTSINPGNTNTHTLSAYVYDGTSGNVGGIVSATIAKLVYDGSTSLTTTYTDVGGGWWRLSYSGTVTNATTDYGVAVLSGKTVYVDGVQLEEKGIYSSTFAARTYLDGSFGTGYSWSGTANESTSTRAPTVVRYDSTNNINGAIGTISFWTYRDTLTGSGAILFRWANAGTNDMIVSCSGTSCSFQRKIDGGSYSSVTRTIPLKQWTHVSLTWDTSNIGLFTNGVGSTVGSVGTFSGLPQYLNLVGYSDTAFLPNSIYSEYRIYTTVLSSTEVADLYYTGLGSHSEQVISTERYTDGEPPVLAWHMDEGYGTALHDSTTYLNHGTISGATWSDDSIGGGPNSKSLKFDGVDDKISRTYSSDTELAPALQSFSVGGWFKSPSSVSSIQYLVSRYNTSGYKLWMSATGTICFGVDDDSSWGPDDSACTTTTYADSNWHQVLVTFRHPGLGSGSISIYIDAVLATSNNSLTITGSLSGTSPTLYVGIDSDGTSNPWSGFIDEVRIYNSARSEEQVNTEFVARGSNKGTSVVLSAREGSTLSNGLVGYWKMDESLGSMIADTSGNGRTMTLASSPNAPSWISGKYASALSFDGASNPNADYGTASLPDAIKSNTGSFSIGAWINQQAITGNTVIAAKSGYWGGFYPGVYSNSIVCGLVNSNNQTFNVSYSATLSTWNYYLCSYDSNAQSLNLYVNGSLYQSTPFSGTVRNYSDTLLIGGYNGNYGFNGYLDELRVYNRALSPVEVRALYEYAPGPVAYWNMDEGTGQSANDISGNNNTGTLGANSSPGSDDPSWTNGKYGKGLSFDGSNDFVTTGSSPVGIPIGSSPRSAFTWVYLRAQNPSNFSGIFGWGTTNIANYNADLLIKSDRTLYFWSFNQDFGTSLTVPLNAWSYLGYTFDGTNLKVYLNNQSQSVVIPLNTASTAVRIGRDASGRTIDGLIDDVRIYNYARTQKQITQDMNAGHPAVGSPVGSAVAHYKFDEGQGDTVHNSGSGGVTYNNDLAGVCPGGATCPTWSNDGKFAKALSFDGINDSASTGNVFTDLGTSNKPYSFTGWFRANTGETDGNIVFMSGGGYCLPPVTLDSSRLTSFSWTGGLITATGSTAIQSNIWYHYAITWGPINGLRVYLNGRLDGSQSQSTYIWSNTANSISYGWGGSCSGDQGYFNGSIDEAKIYNYDLNEDEVKLDYNQGKSIVMGSTSTASDGSTASNSANRAYCVPGDTSTCSPPVAEWNLDEGTGTSVADSSGNANTGTWNGSGTHWTNGKVGKAGKFNGSSDRVEVADSPSISVFPNGLTVSLWFNTSGTAGGSRLLMKDYSSWEYAFEIYSGGIDAYLNNQYLGRFNHNLNQWQYLTMAYDKQRVKVYLDGVLKINNAFTQELVDSAGVLYIGSYSYAGGYYTGNIDQVRIYDYARTQAQISWDYNQGAPMAWYKLDECSGNTVHSQNETYDANLNGTINIGATLPQSSAGTCGSGVSTEAWNNGTNGKFNGSLNFDGVDDYISFANSNNSISNTSNYTISAWFKTTGASAIDGRIYTEGSTTTNIPIVLLGYGFTGTEITFVARDDANSQVTLPSTKTGLNNNQWHHAIAIRNGSNFTLYIDGVASGTTSGSIGTTTINKKSIGAHERASVAAYFPGQIDDVRIYNYALTEKQVEDAYNGGAVRYGN